MWPILFGLKPKKKQKQKVFLKFNTSTEMTLVRENILQARFQVVPFIGRRRHNSCFIGGILGFYPMFSCTFLQWFVVQDNLTCILQSNSPSQMRLSNDNLLLSLNQGPLHSVVQFQ